MKDRKAKNSFAIQMRAVLFHCKQNKRQMKTHLSHKAGATGFEPVSTVLETVALPLNYTPMSSDSFMIAWIFDFVNRKVRDFCKFLEQKRQFVFRYVTTEEYRYQMVIFDVAVMWKKD